MIKYKSVGRLPTSDLLAKYRSVGRLPTSAPLWMSVNIMLFHTMNNNCDLTQNCPVSMTPYYIDFLQIQGIIVSFLH
jgi:hypothetical protein